MSKIFVLLLILVAAALPASADTTAESKGGDLMFRLPDNWHQVSDPDSLFVALPNNLDGRVFGVVAEDNPMCPIPRPIDEESDYEKTFWNRWELLNFERKTRTAITSREFREIKGLPFRVFHAIRGSEKEPQAKLFVEEAITPANGKMYEFLLTNKNEEPADDHEIQGIFNSFTFVKPPKLAWYQPLLPHFSDFAGTPLLLVVLGLGGYYLKIRRQTEVSVKRKANVVTTAFCLTFINGMWIAGPSSIVGIISLVLLAPFVLALQQVNKESRAQIAAGKIPAPTQEQVRRRFMMIGLAAGFGLALINIQFLMSGYSFTFIGVVDVLTIAVMGAILWSQWQRLFPAE